MVAFGITFRNGHWSRGLQQLAHVMQEVHLHLKLKTPPCTKTWPADGQLWTAAGALRDTFFNSLIRQPVKCPASSAAIEIRRQQKAGPIITKATVLSLVIIHALSTPMKPSRHAWRTWFCPQTKSCKLPITLHISSPLWSRVHFINICILCPRTNFHATDTTLVLLPQTYCADFQLFYALFSNSTNATVLSIL